VKHRSSPLPSTKPSEFRSAAIAFFLEQMFEQSSWVASILFAYEHNGTKAAGMFMSAMLLVAALMTPIQSRLLERRSPFAAARVQLAAQTLAAMITSLSVLLGAPVLLTWVGLGLIVCTATTAPSVLLSLIPSTARDAESLAVQTAKMGWMESAALIVGPVVAAAVLGATSIRQGVGLLTLMGAVTLLLGRFLLRTHAKQEHLALVEHWVGAEAPSARGNQSQYSERALLRLPGIRTLIVITLGAYLTIGALDVLFVPVAQLTGMNENRAGLLAGAYGIGGLLSFVASRRVLGRPRLVGSLTIVAIIGSAAIVGLALTSDRPIGAFVLCIIAGAARSVFVVVYRVLLQRSSPAGSLLRVAGIVQVVVTLGYAAGVLVPWLGGSTQRACLVTGLLLPIAMAVVLRGLRRIDDSANVPVTEIALLRRVAILRSLQPESLEALARQGEMRVHRSQPIVNEGDDSTEMFVIVDGHAEAKQGDRLLRTMTRGDVFGEIGLIRRQRRSATVSAVGEVKVFAIPGADFVALVGLNDGVSQAVETLIQQRP
jgi:Cyclic nucleotide-binding domain/Major Facilitator Superfamily